MAGMSKMAMSSDFLDAFARLPRAQQRGVRSLIARFNVDSTASGLNYERIHGSRDPAMRSLRIDQGYRAIVLKPEQGNVHMLLWADKHDAAYTWATRHECRINSETGALQVYEPRAHSSGEASGRQVEAPEVSTAQPPAFRVLRDRELARLGVPSAMLAEVRGVRDDTDLDSMQVRLPVEAYEALFLYLAGETYDQLVLDREAPVEPVDTGDFAKALERNESRGRFVVVDDEMELEAMLNAPLERWRVFLHPSQRRLVERHWKGPARVLGGAGTGKTVVAMHRARWLARNLPGRGRILFTTFTKNLAADIEHNLRSICTPEDMARIEVTNLDRWVVRFLRGRRYEFRIVYGRDPDAWQRALDLKSPELDVPDAFYDDEWEQVVQAHGVTTRDEYLRISRVGRGARLNRAMRDKAWRVFKEYRIQLVERGLKEVDDAFRDAAALLSDDPDALDYAAVIVDEAQDMGAQSYRLIRNLVPASTDDLFIVGDGHQRIYGRNKVVLSRCGIDIRGRSRKLRLNYRTSEQTRRWAARLLAGRAIDDLDGGSDDDTGDHFPDTRTGTAGQALQEPGRAVCIHRRLSEGNARQGHGAARRLHRRPHPSRARRGRGRTPGTRADARATRSRRHRLGRNGGCPSGDHASRQGPGVRPRHHGQRQCRPGSVARRARRTRGRRGTGIGGDRGTGARVCGRHTGQEGTAGPELRHAEPVAVGSVQQDSFA